MTDAETIRSITRSAFTRADELERDILTRWPDAWRQMDHMRTHPPQPWPEWCLLPMAAAAGVTDAWTPTGPALYAWRHARSVYDVKSFDRGPRRLPRHGTRLRARRQRARRRAGYRSGRLCRAD